MDSLDRPLGGAEFAPKKTYLNTSTCGLMPRRTVEAVTLLARETADGRPGGSGSFEIVDEARATFARLVGVAPERVAVGSSVAVHCGMIAQSLPAGAEVLFPEGDFSSVITPFTIRGDLKVRFAPLDRLAASVRPETDLVASSASSSRRPPTGSASARTAACTT
ncbi:aminotransferase, partial [Streptomyces sp. NPDC006324]